MRLLVNHSPGAFVTFVSCIRCGLRARLADCVADLDGPAFVAYYCVGCRPRGIDVPSCAHSKCRLCAPTGPGVIYV